MTPAETGFPKGGDAWPLWTVTYDGKPMCVVKAREPRQAAELGQGVVTHALHDMPGRRGPLLPLTARQRARMGARPPTDAERQHYAQRVLQLPPGVAAVALP